MGIYVYLRYGKELLLSFLGLIVGFWMIVTALGLSWHDIITTGKSLSRWSNTSSITFAIPFENGERMGLESWLVGFGLWLGVLYLSASTASHIKELAEKGEDISTIRAILIALGRSSIPADSGLPGYGKLEQRSLFNALIWLLILNLIDIMTDTVQRVIPHLEKLNQPNVTAAEEVSLYLHNFGEWIAAFAYSTAAFNVGSEFLLLGGVAFFSSNFREIATVIMGAKAEESRPTTTRRSSPATRRSSHTTATEVVSRSGSTGVVVEDDNGDVVAVRRPMIDTAETFSRLEKMGVPTIVFFTVYSGTLVFIMYLAAINRSPIYGAGVGVAGALIAYGGHALTMAIHKDE